MDRIEASELIELEQAEGMAFKPLKFDLQARTSKKVSKHISTRNQDTAAQIWPLLEPYKDTPPKDPEKLKRWTPFTFKALLGIIGRKGPEYCFQCYRQVAEEFDRGKVDNPLPLFLWKIAQSKVVMKEVSLK